MSLRLLPMANLNCLSQFKNPRRVKIESKIPIREYGKDSPGPKYGAIDTTLHKHHRSTSIPFTAGSRDGPGLTRVLTNPGPGKYGAPGPSCIDTSSGKGFSFGASVRNQKSKDIVPGPGSYKKESTLINMPLTMAGASTAQGKSSLVPGPGTYAPSFVHLEKAAPRMSFTCGAQDVQVKDKCMPGPGNYEVQSTLNGNSTMKRSSVPLITGASVEMKKNITPGFMAQPTFKCP